MENKKKDKESRFKLALNCTPIPSWWKQAKTLRDNKILFPHWFEKTQVCPY